MKLYAVTDHDGFWPVGTASIVMAKDEDHARRLLDAELKLKGLKTSEDVPYSLCQVPQTMPKAIILNDGNY